MVSQMVLLLFSFLSSFFLVACFKATQVVAEPAV